MPGACPGHPRLFAAEQEDVDGRDKPCHDPNGLSPTFNLSNSSRAVLSGTVLRSRSDGRPSFVLNFQPFNIKGRRECRAPDAPVASRAKIKKHELVTTVYAGTAGIPRADGFNGFLRALPGDRAFLSPSSLRSVSFLRT